MSEFALFRELTPEQAQEFVEWARQNYTPFAPIQGFWHPAVQRECAEINAEAQLKIDGTDITTVNIRKERL